MDYVDYFSGAQLIHFMLGPATIALAVPLYEQRKRVSSALQPLAAATACGALTSIGLTVFGLKFASATHSVIVSCAPKSVTTPVALAVAEQLGGLAPLTAGVVLITGVCGAITAPSVLRLTTIRRPRTEAARGFALGMCAHGAGTARAFQDSNEAGVFAGLAIGLNALVTAIVVPIVISLTGY